MTSLHTSNVSFGSNKNQRIGACALSLWFVTCFLSPNSHRVITRLLHLYSPRVFTYPLPCYSPQVCNCPLCSHSPRAFTCLLWGRNTPPTYRCIPPSACKSCTCREHPTVCVWGSFVFTPCWWPSSWFQSSYDLGVHVLLHMHQGGLHSFHGSSDYVYVSLNMR